MKALKQISTGVAASAFLIFGLCSQNALAKQPTPGFNQKIPDYIMTPNTVNTRIGELSFYDGIPDKKTLTKVYDNLDFMRGVDVFLNFIPATSIEGMRMGMKELGVDASNKVAIFDDLMDSNPLFLKSRPVPAPVH